MPFIHTITTKKLSADQKAGLKTELGKIICDIPGKSEKWLMLAFSDGTDMYFHGDDSADTAFVEIKIFGSASDDAYDTMTKHVCSLMHDMLGISPDRVYVKYEEVDHWGWNGANF